MVGANRFRMMLVALAALVASLMVLAVTKQAGAANVLGQNLIRNGGAEAGKGSSSGFDVVPVPKWNEKGNFTVIKYTAGGGFPTPEDPGPPDRGNKFFAGGPRGLSSSASQVADVSANAREIDDVDTGVTFTLSGYLGGFGGQEDNAKLTARFRGADGSVLAESTIGPVTATDRNNQTALLLRTSEGTVPAGTRTIRILLEMTRAGGTSNDGYADNLSLVLTTPNATPLP
jgi:hypothetical protein